LKENDVKSRKLCRDFLRESYAVFDDVSDPKLKNQIIQENKVHFLYPQSLPLFKA
jgi:hypothetical protein